MKNRYTAYFSAIIIIVFNLYIIYDTTTSEPSAINGTKKDVSSIPDDKWKISDSVSFISGKLKAVSVSFNGDILLGGDSFVACYNERLEQVWSLNSPNPVTSLSISGDTIYAASQETILLLNKSGKIIDKWGPFEDSCIITSVTSNKAFIAFADAGNKLVFIIKKSGELQSIIGQTGKKFIIPSPYFDIALTSDNNLVVANTGERMVETRNFDGDLISFFGEPGIAPEAFCGCCNPAHFALFRDGLVTAEKGINRIKIVDRNGKFVEFVSSRNRFFASIPLDIAISEKNIIYAANPVDSKLYIFTKKENK